MKSGKLFELLIEKMLSNAGFLKVEGDDLYIFNGPAGLMINGLGQAHNADVLMSPPAQTPFYFPSRILIECKDYKKPANLNVLRSALGLREDINAFEIIDAEVLKSRRISNRSWSVYNYQRYHYQVGVASFKGFTIAAQEFAMAHRIPLITFDKMPFWNLLSNMLDELNADNFNMLDEGFDRQFIRACDNIAEKISVAMLDDGQMLFLYNLSNRPTEFSEDFYDLYWQQKNSYWILKCGSVEYAFQLPRKIQEEWLKNSNSYNTLRYNALSCKEHYLSHLVVYYLEGGLAKIKILSISKERLQEAYGRFRMDNF